MIYYKITEGENIIDVNTDIGLRYVNYADYCNSLMMCEPNENPIGIIASDGSVVYHIIGADPIPDSIFGEYKDVIITEIEEEDYEIFKRTLDEQKEMVDPDPYIPEPEPEPEKTEEELAAEAAYLQSLQFVRDNKIAFMSYTCHQIIENGITVELSDGEAHHFALTYEDQINLMERQAQIANGAQEVSYHADNGQCVFYSAADMITIIQASIYHKDYQTTYFNSLKYYINSMDDIAEISEVYYGMEIPEEYQSEPLKRLLEAAE